MTAPDTEAARVAEIAGKFDANTIERFWRKVDKTETCWTWKAHCNARGYGTFSVNNRTVRAHRFAWQLANTATIPPDMLVCHSCDNPTCVNPNHLWLGTKLDNYHDMIAKGRAGGPAADNTSKTHCVHGHPLFGENMSVFRHRRFPERACKTCKRVREAQRRERLRNV